jgi:mRNA interferase RelE/StbE
LKTFAIIILPKAEKDLDRLPKEQVRAVLNKLSKLEQGLTGDIKKLKEFEPAFRLRVGELRVLFDLKDTTILVHRVVHRRDAYR